MSRIGAEEEKEADVQGTLQTTVSVSDSISLGTLATRTAARMGVVIKLREAQDKIMQVISNEKASGAWHEGA